MSDKEGGVKESQHEPAVTAERHNSPPILWSAGVELLPLQGSVNLPPDDAGSLLEPLSPADTQRLTTSINEQGSPLSKQGSKTASSDEHWNLDDKTFRAEEERRRDSNLTRWVSSGAATRGAFLARTAETQAVSKVFFSHCWRGQESQLRKKRLCAALTGNDGVVIWADFLDLCAQGPVPWRKEIGEAIESCAKMVCIIDREYLLSYNCLEELAYAIHYNKPLVLGILDQDAWEMLAMVEGPEHAWSREPAVGTALCRYDGQPFGPKAVPFSQEEVRRIFCLLSAINFCPCRDIDEANLGARAVDERFREYVSKDLSYSKEHADLCTRADTWHAAGRPLHMLLKGSAAVYWKDWVKVAAVASAFPEPTEQMRDYVAASSHQARFRRKLLRAGGIALFAVITILAVFAGVSYLQAESKTREAVRLQKVAVRQQAIATVLLLSDTAEPRETAELHALLRAAEIAQCIGYPSLVMPALTAAVSYMMQRPWFFDLKGHGDRVSRVAFDPSGKFLASASYDGTARIRVMAEPRTPNELPLPSTAEPAVLDKCNGKQIRALAWSNTGLLATSCGSVGSVFVWGQPPGSSCWVNHFRLTGHGNDVVGLAWSGDGALLASSDDDGHIRVWRIKDALSSGTVSGNVVFQEVVNRIEEGAKKPSAIRSLSFAPHMPLLASVGLSEMVELWYFDNNKPPVMLQAIGLNHTADITSVAWSPDGTILASTGDTGELCLWAAPQLDSNGDSAELHLLGKEVPHPDDIRDLAWSSDGKSLATVAHVVGVSSVVVDDVAGTATLAREATYEDGDVALFSVDIHPQHSDVLVMGTASNEVRGWRAAEDLTLDGPERFFMNCTGYYPEEFAVRGSDFSADGHTYAASAYWGYVCVWRRKVDPETGVVGAFELSGALRIPQSEIRSVPSRSVAISPGADMLAAGDDFAGMTVWSWSDTTGSWEVTHQWRNTERNRTSSAAAELDSSSKLRGVAWSADGRFISAGSSNKTVAVLPVGSGGGDGLLLKGHTDVVELTCWTEKSDGTVLLASGSEDNTVRVWTLRRSVSACALGQSVSLELVGVREMAEHTHHLSSLAWSSAGLLASGSKDAVVLVHEVPGEGRPLHLHSTLSGHTGAVSGLSWAEDGRHLASASLDSTVRLWTVPEAAGEEAAVWVLAERCKWVRWISLKTPRLACARRSPAGQVEPPAGEAPYTFFVSYFLVDFQQQLDLLRRMTYGQLDEGDLSKMGLLDVRDIALASSIDGQTCRPEDPPLTPGCVA